MTRRARATESNPDAELIALGKRFVEIQKRLKTVRAEAWRLGNEAQDYAFRLTGWDPTDPENPTWMWGQYAAAEQEMGDRNGSHACDERLEALHREVDPIMRGIMDTPATSIAGLRVKTLIAIDVNEKLWEKRHHDLDWELKAVRSLIEAACVVSGVPVPKEEPERVAEYDGDARSHPGSAGLN
jgi:hypothetical protein